MVTAPSGHVTREELGGDALDDRRGKGANIGISRSRASSLVVTKAIASTSARPRRTSKPSPSSSAPPSLTDARSPSWVSLVEVDVRVRAAQLRKSTER
jgi:hypothetical protein